MNCCLFFCDQCHEYSISTKVSKRRRSTGRALQLLCLHSSWSFCLSCSRHSDGTHRVGIISSFIRVETTLAYNAKQQSVLTLEAYGIMVESSTQ